MKIKLSRSQWEAVGKKAGWIKIAQETPNPDHNEVKMCIRCKKRPALDSYSTCKECHDKSLDEAEATMLDRGGDPS